MLDVLIDLDYRRRLYTVGDIARRDMLSTFSRLSFIGEENSNYRVFVYRVFFRRPGYCGFHRKAAIGYSVIGFTAIGFTAIGYSAIGRAGTR